MFFHQERKLFGKENRINRGGYDLFLLVYTGEAGRIYWPLNKFDYLFRRKISVFIKIELTFLIISGINKA